VGGFGEKDLQ